MIPYDEANGLHWKPTIGGATGPHLLLMLGDQYIGHFYPDPSSGINTLALLEEIARAYNERRAKR